MTLHTPLALMQQLAPGDVWVIYPFCAVGWADGAVGCQRYPKYPAYIPKSFSQPAKRLKLIIRILIQ
ncbi:MAG: hypothetical protein WCK35_16885 [Chloroflexota bacterium]